MRHYMILVVEDDPLLRMNAVILFEEAGFTVNEFATADAAVAFIRQHASEIGAVFTDITMPGRLDGLQLASMVTSTWPGITVLVTSGSYAERPPRLPPGVEYIAKPWLPLDLLVTMQRAADAHQPH